MRIRYKNYGLNNKVNNVYRENQIQINAFSSDGLDLNSFLFGGSKCFNKFTFFLSFKHKEDEELVINFITENPFPLTPNGFRLRIDNYYTQY